MTAGTDQKVATSQRFMWAVQALSRPADEQVALFPEFVEVADELVLEHEEAHNNFVAAVGASLAGAQRSAVMALDEYIAGMSGQDKLENWTIEAMQSSPEWVKLRELAGAVLDAMSWQRAAPPKERGDIFVGAPQDANRTELD